MTSNWYRIFHECFRTLLLAHQVWHHQCRAALMSGDNKVVELCVSFKGRSCTRRPRCLCSTLFPGASENSCFLATCPMETLQRPDSCSRRGGNSSLNRSCRVCRLHCGALLPSQAQFKQRWIVLWNQCRPDVLIVIRIKHSRCVMIFWKCLTLCWDIHHTRWWDSNFLHSPSNTLYLKVQCSAVRPPLVVVSNSSVVDFQQVAVGEWLSVLASNPLLSNPPPIISLSSNRNILQANNISFTKCKKKQNIFADWWCNCESHHNKQDRGNI